jgi:hypothetical protein
LYSPSGPNKGFHDIPSYDSGTVLEKDSLLTLIQDVIEWGITGTACLSRMSFAYYTSMSPDRKNDEPQNEENGYTY